jgi:U3 small nucleolar RNA-associated protein 21
VTVFDRTHPVLRLGGAPEGSTGVASMAFLGHVLVVAFDGAPSLCAYSLPASSFPASLGARSAQPDRIMHLQQHFPSDRITCLAHPSTYLNKVLLGLSTGSAALVNVDSCRLLYTFRFHLPSPPCAVRCVAPAPALDIAAFGFDDGSVAVQNLRYNQRVCTFQHPSTAPPCAPAAVTALSFRSGPGEPLLAAGGDDGAISVWSLDERTLHSTLSPSHRAQILSADFLEGQPTLITCGADNALKMHSFDLHGSAGRLLKSRGGHFRPLTCVRFDGHGKRVVSSALDHSMRVHHIRRDAHSLELSQGRAEKRRKRFNLPHESFKLPPARSFALSALREHDWDSLVSCHHSGSTCHTWSMSRYALGSHELDAPGKEASVATCVSISACGSCAHVGYESGEVHAFSMQSGIHRGTFRRNVSRADGNASQPARSREADLWQLAAWDQWTMAGSTCAHDSRVSGVASDGSNRMAVSAGRDACVRIWGFHDRLLLHELKLASPGSLLHMHRSTALCAVACEDHFVRICDCESARCVRSFKAASDRICDIDVTSDARWVLVASMDAKLTIFDIPASQALQVMHLQTPIVSLSVSPTMDLLATAHAGACGIVVWGNAVLCGAVPQAHLGREVTQAPLAGVTDVDEPEDEGSEAMESSDGTEIDAELSGAASLGSSPLAPASAEQIQEGCITTSRAPRSKWNALVHIEAVKERNKPQQPLVDPEPAPFILPPEAAAKPGPASHSRVKRGDAASHEIPFVADEAPKRQRLDTDPGGAPQHDARAQKTLLRTFAEASEHGDDEGTTRALDALEHASPSAIDAELSLLGLAVAPSGALLEEEDERLLHGALSVCKDATERGLRFEAVQAFLSALLRVHGQAMRHSAKLRARANELSHSLSAQWERLDASLHSARCMVGFLRCDSTMALVPAYGVSL